MASASSPTAAPTSAPSAAARGVCAHLERLGSVHKVRLEHGDDVVGRAALVVVVGLGCFLRFLIKLNNEDELNHQILFFAIFF